MLFASLLLVASWAIVLDSLTAPPYKDTFHQIAIQRQIDVNPQKAQPSTEDPRDQQLSAFFTHYNCPELSFQLINTYIHAADQNNLDYRILPAISVQESGCGRHYPQGSNNIFGWDSGRERFSSLPQAASFVAQQLAIGHYYRGKTAFEKLRAYNPNPSYALNVYQLMQQIDEINQTEEF
jgi:hypothetical protein